MQIGDTLWNFKSKLPETPAFKGTCYKTKKSFTDGRNPAKKLNFWVTAVTLTSLALFFIEIMFLLYLLIVPAN